MNNTPTIFISHASEDKEHAIWLKNKLATYYNSEARIFISEDIQGGKDWRGEIDENLLSGQVAILLCSPIAIEKAWVIFEAGMCKGKGIPFVPLLFAGATNAMLPTCINCVQAQAATETRSLALAFKTIQKCINNHTQLPLDEIAVYFSNILTQQPEKSLDYKITPQKSIVEQHKYNEEKLTEMAKKILVSASSSSSSYQGHILFDKINSKIIMPGLSFSSDQHKEWTTAIHGINLLENDGLILQISDHPDLIAEYEITAIGYDLAEKIEKENKWLANIGAASSVPMMRQSRRIF